MFNHTAGDAALTKRLLNALPTIFDKITPTVLKI
jgi:hypothetical protein